jgi:hypothetical protein
VQSARRALHRMAGVGIVATFAFGLLSASNNSKKTDNGGCFYNLFQKK